MGSRSEDKLAGSCVAMRGEAAVIDRFRYEVAERGMKPAALGEKDSSVHGNGSSVLQQVFKAGESAFAWMDLCLSEIKSGHIRDAIRRGPGGKEYALPSLRCAIGEHPCPKPSACASH